MYVFVSKTYSISVARASSAFCRSSRRQVLEGYDSQIFRRVVVMGWCCWKFFAARGGAIFVMILVRGVGWEDHQANVNISLSTTKYLQVVEATCLTRCGVEYS